MSADAALATIGAFDRDLVVQAGAGTGKTHALVTLYLHLVTGLGARPEPLSPVRILVITFTDKAAGELRERIRERLAALVEHGLRSEPALEESRARRERAAPDPTLLRRALAELTRAPIGTFHAIGQSLLRRHAVVAGLDPQFSLIDEVEARARALDAARGATLDALAAGDRAVEALVEMMGFGGRDRAGLVEALVRLRGTLAEEGRAAAGLAAAYDEARLAEESAAAQAGIDEALRGFARLGEAVRDKSAERAARIAAAAGDPALRGPEAETRLGPLLGELRHLRAVKGHEETVAAAKEALRTAGERLADARAGLEAAPQARAVERLLGETEARYAAWKRAAGVADFGDLIQLPRRLLRERADLARREQGRYDAILVDEFQDTNATQAELIELLAGAGEAEGAGRRFVVGDRKQSIYEFRGADVGVFTEVTETLKRSGAGEVLLRRSFRSVPKVVALCNALFARAFGPGPQRTAWGLAFDPARDALEPVREDVADAAAELLRVATDDEALPADEARAREARAIATHARALIEGGRRAGDLALLLRRYTHLPSYLRALRRAGVPHYVVRGRGFYEAQEIRDLAALLQLLHDPADRIALVAVLRSPLCGISDEGIAILAARRQLETWSLVDREPALTIGLAADDHTRLAELVERYRALRAVHERLRPDVLLREAVARFDLEAIWAGAPDGAQKIANLEQLVARAGVMLADSQGAAADLPAFVRWLNRAVRPQGALEAAGAQIVDERDDVLRVMTVHQSKGLQFPVVFVADCGATVFPDHGPLFYEAKEGLGLKIADPRGGPRRHTSASRRVAALRAARQQAESLRLFYVAATRARDRVVFSGERRPRDESWRRALDQLQAEGGDLLTIVDGTIARPRALPAPSPPAAALDAPAVDTLPGLVAFAPSRAAGLRVAVTQLQDFAQCARRYHLFHELGLDEHPDRSRPAPADLEGDAVAGSDTPADPLRSGTLAHRLLERCRFGLGDDAARAELRELLASDGYDAGYDAADPLLHEIVEAVLGFLSTDYARSLARRPLRRELPFSLALPGAGGLRQLRGTMDLVVLEEDGISVIDYKHARRGDLADHALQLDAYALAAASLYPQAPRVRVGLVFLREPTPRVDWVTVDPPAVIGARLGALVERLVEARLSGERPGVPRATCDSIGCGYRAWCHRSVEARDEDEAQP